MLFFTALIAGLAAALPADDNAQSNDKAAQVAGRMTVFYAGLGACGKTHTDADYVLAISHTTFDAQGVANPNNNPLCGRKINITYGGKTIQAELVDRCVACTPDHIDLAFGPFQTLTGQTTGNLPVTWDWA